MEKYEIKKQGVDDYLLTYKDQEIHFKSTVNIVNKLQDATRQARFKMINDLAKEGKTVKDLIVETNVDGKTILDHSNKDYIEEVYLQQEQTTIFNEAIKEMLGISLEDLIVEIGLDEKEVEEFGADLGRCMIGTPRG